MTEAYPFDNAVDISLIICTRNRARSLSRCLAAVSTSECASTWEVIVVDNGSSDNTQQIVTSFAKGFPAPLRLVLESRQGAGRARNTGISESQGRILAFTDDDCYVDKNFLSETLRAFSEKTIGYVSGRITLHDPEDIPYTINESTTPSRFEPFSHIEAGRVQGANLAFRREVLDTLNGFDPRLGAGTPFPCEDCDVAGRASALGWAGLFVPSISVSHHHGRKIQDFEALFQGYDRGRGAYHMKLFLDGHRKQSMTGWSSLKERWRWRKSTPYWEFLGAGQFLLTWILDGWKRVASQP